MAYIYKLDNNWVSSALMPLESIFESATIKATDKAVNIFVANDIALGINVGSKRIVYKDNGILFKTSKVSKSSSNVTFVTRPSIENGFVQWSGDFNRENIINDIFGIKASKSPKNMEFTLDSKAKTITSGDEAPFTISWTSDTLNYNGNAITGTPEFTSKDMTFTIDVKRLLATLNGDFSKMNTLNYVAPDKPYDLSCSVINGDNGIFKEEEIKINYNDIVFDDFGNEYYSIPNYDFKISKDAIWFPNDNTKYLENDQFSFIRGAHTDGNAFAEFNKDKLRSAVNTSKFYENGLIECSVRTYIGYAKVYSSHMYVDYYYIKSNDSKGECAKLNDSVSYGRACRLKITNSSITMRNVDSSISHIALIANANDKAHDAYSKMRFGVGSFKSDHKLYTYKDKRDYIEVEFDRETSSKYIKIRIDDQPTRYAATITTRSGRQKSTHTKHFGRYSSHPLWDLGNTAFLNMVIKKSFDNVSDTVETLFTNGAVTLEPDSIKILTRTLYTNIMNQAISFPQINLTYNTLAVVAWPDSDGNVQNLQINFQPATGAIYGRIAQGSSYDYYSKDDLVKMLNSVNSNYSFDMTCNISKLIYTDVEGKSHDYAFTNSTMLIGAVMNGTDGEFYRVYYKNADSYGFVVAKKYSIEE